MKKKKRGVVASYPIVIWQMPAEPEHILDPLFNRYPNGCVMVYFLALLTIAILILKASAS